MVVQRHAASAGSVLELIRTGEAVTRADLMAHTGLSRSTLSERLDVLFGAGLIEEGAGIRSGRGRPSRQLGLNARTKVVCAVDIGEDHLRLVMTDLSARLLAEVTYAVHVAEGPKLVIGHIARGLRSLLASAEKELSDVLGLALAVPAPVDFARGLVGSPSVMTGWEGVDTAAMVREELDVPVLVENDVNARGLGEYLAHWRQFDHVLYVKVGTGIGSAILTGGQLFRGALGAAGDVGHIRLEPQTGPLCRCGAIGCVEAFAAGWALARDLREEGIDVTTTTDVVASVQRNVPVATHLVREAGRTLGRAIAYCVSLLNPSLVVIGGSLSTVGGVLMTGVRESIYQYSLPLATRDLVIATAQGDNRTGAIGAAHLVLQEALSPDKIDATLSGVHASGPDRRVLVRP